MKKSDIAMIILIASAGVLIAYFASQAIPGLKHDKNHTEQVVSADEISPELPEVDTRVFSKDAINPTVEIIIGNE